MSDRSHFDEMRQLQQKVEYARSMKQRFGQRAGFARPRKDGDAQEVVDDDAFFASLKHGNEDQTTSMKRSAADSRPDGQIDSVRHEPPLEQYLDDLLKL